jgi:YVTN family beta-propeller protein
VINGETLRPLKVLSGFDQPHIAAIAPDGQHAYVTDDASGTLTAIDLARLRVTSTIRVGVGAHHLCFDAKDHLAWVALGESARRLVLLSTQDLDHPRVTGRFPPSSPVHDLACSAAPRGFGSPPLPARTSRWWMDSTRASSSGCPSARRRSM